MQELINKEEINHEVLVLLLRKIIELLDTKEEPLESVSVDNLDEVGASLQNNISKQTKNLVTALAEVKQESGKQTKVVNKILDEIKTNLTDNFTSTYIKKPIDQVEILNLDEIRPLDNITVTNLSDLAEYFEKLSSEIRDSLNINVAAPNINVPAPIVNIPAPIVNTPEIDLSPILDELDRQLNKIRTNSVTRPLAVRISDGQEWIKELRKQTAQTTQYMSDVSYIKNAAGIRINPATADAPSTLLNGKVTVTTAGTEVQISASSVSVKSITIKSLAANTGTIYIGNSTVASTNGYALAAGQAISFDIDDLNKVYIDSSVNGEGVTYLAVN